MNPVRDLKQCDVSDEHSTEIDVCRQIECCLLCESSNQERLKELLANLRRRQSPDGLWTNTGRTAHVLVFLLERLDVISSLKYEDAAGNICEQLIYNGVLALRSKYNWSNGNWDNDLQATAKATHAIGLYNARYKYSTQDFLKVIESETEQMQSSGLVCNLSERLSQLFNEANEGAKSTLLLKEANRQSAAFRKLEIVWRLAAFCCASVLVAGIAYLAIDNRPILKEAIRSVGLISILVGLVVTLVSGWIVERIISKKAASNAPQSKK